MVIEGFVDLVGACVLCQWQLGVDQVCHLVATFQDFGELLNRVDDVLTTGDNGLQLSLGDKSTGSCLGGGQFFLGTNQRDIPRDDGVGGLDSDRVECLRLLWSLELRQRQLGNRQITVFLDMAEIGFILDLLELGLKGFFGQRRTSIGVFDPVDRVQVTEVG